MPELNKTDCRKLGGHCFDETGQCRHCQANLLEHNTVQQLIDKFTQIARDELLAEFDASMEMSSGRFNL